MARLAPLSDCTGGGGFSIRDRGEGGGVLDTGSPDWEVRQIGKIPTNGLIGEQARLDRLLPAILPPDCELHPRPSIRNYLFRNVDARRADFLVSEGSF